jgi:predicted transcriptional regulator
MATTITLSDELRDRLDTHTARTGASMNKVIALALDQYLFIQERAEELHRDITEPDE